ncbi:MAG TPA: LuxR C-terminal-related transcriptional regulator [Gaiellaceae bacterium]|jgi:LuxR family maltose regulon positive regulatory protein
MPELLETKLHPPSLRSHTVMRDRLVERLRAESGVKLVLVAAPAGYGKTTLLGSWRGLESKRRPVAWLTLDESDNDPVVLWSQVHEAIKRVCPAFDVSVTPERVGAARIPDVVLPRIVNGLADQTDAVLVLDDFHLLSSGPARDGVSWLVEHAPSSFQLVLSSRSEPALPLAALRAHGQLIEVRADELGFTLEEADALLNGQFELDLESEVLGGLVDRTEGWPTGLYLAALSMRGVKDPRAFASDFGGRNRYVVDFLVDEVLDAHDAQTQELMLRSSILERMSGPLCDAVLEREGSAELLADLARRNLFLLPLDDRGEWYRFHHLFAQLLRVELEAREPGLGPNLHQRAFEWHRDHGSTGEALTHALDAGAFPEAIALVTRAWRATVSTGRRATALAWLERFPPELSSRDPQLLLMAAWMLSEAGRRDEAAAAIADLERLEWPCRGVLPDGFSSLEASLATLRAWFPWGDVGAGYAQALRAAELQTQEAPAWAAVCWALGIGCYYRGDGESADRWFDETAEVGQATERWLSATSALAYRSFLAGERGQIAEQHLLAERAAELARAHGTDGVRGEVHIAMGVSLAARGEPREALFHLAHGVAVLRSSGEPIQLANGLICQARVLLGARRRDEAAAAIGEAKKIVDSAPDPGILRGRLQAVEQAPRSRKRRQAADLSDRELDVLRMLGGPLSERDIGRELYLSHNTVHSHTRSIYRKLGVSSRKQALLLARELGLL